MCPWIKPRILSILQQESKTNIAWALLFLTISIAVPAGLFRWYDSHAQLSYLKQYQTTVMQYQTEIIKEQIKNLHKLPNNFFFLLKPYDGFVDEMYLFVNNLCWEAKAKGNWQWQICGSFPDFSILKKKEIPQIIPQGLALHRSIELQNLSKFELVSIIPNHIISERTNRSSHLLTFYVLMQAFMLPWPVSRLIKTFRQKQEHQANIQQKAFEDPLTKLANRTLFMDRLTQSIKRSIREHSQLAVVFMDLDHFKPVNDTYGHNVGDTLLQEVARRLERVVRKSDTVGRLGGDEFCILLENVEPTIVPGIIAKIRQEIDIPFLIEGHEIKISSCIGISFYSDDGVTPHDLLKAADDRMYEQKKNRP